MKFKTLKITLAGIILFITCLVNVVNAEVIKIDTDNDSFIDTSTNLEWMDFGINNNYSYNSVVSELGSGGIYSEWRLASKDEVYNMWALAFLNVGANFEDKDYYGIEQFRAQDGKNTFGSVFTGITQIMGYNGIHGAGEINEHVAAVGLFQGSNGISYVNNWTYSDEHGISNRDDVSALVDHGNLERWRTDNSVYWSTMLVKKEITEVPNPISLAVFTLGFMGLGICRFKKQSISHFTG